MIETIIVFIVKNKCGNLCDSPRPIALATIMSKLFELVIVLKCDTFHETGLNQFDIKKGHSTEMCTSVLKEMTELYRSCNTSVIIIFETLLKHMTKLIIGYCIEITE